MISLVLIMSLVAPDWGFAQNPLSGSGTDRTTPMKPVKVQAARPKPVSSKPASTSSFDSFTFPSPLSLTNPSPVSSAAPKAKPAAAPPAPNPTAPPVVPLAPNAPVVLPAQNDPTGFLWNNLNASADDAQTSIPYKAAPIPVKDGTSLFIVEANGPTWNIFSVEAVYDKFATGVPGNRVFQIKAFAYNSINPSLWKTHPL